MKSARTMLALARKTAIEKGVRVATDPNGRSAIGFAFSSHEIAQLYMADGFTMKKMHEHLNTWAQLGLVIPVGKIYFIRLADDEAEAIADLNEEKRMRQIHGDSNCIYVSEVGA